MLLWFVGTSIAAVWFVFRDPRFNFRLVVVGALIPDIIDGIGGGAGPMHSVVTVIALLAIVMLITTGRRPVRKPLLAVIIGLFLHLVFDGAFTTAACSGGLWVGLLRMSRLCHPSTEAGSTLGSS